MPHHVPLRAGDPDRVGRYRLTGRLEGLPSDDLLFVGAAPDGAPVVVTLLGGDWARDGAARDRFAAEAAVAKRVPPFCAARVLDAGLDADVAYLVSEYVSGQSLLELVAEEGVRPGPELEALAIGMATGLASVHQAGLVHGSFGPQYLILPAEGPPRVVEYGITPPYGSATPAADMFAWAQTVVFAATGHPPSGLGDLDGLPDRVRQPVQQCLELDSLERPAARAVLQILLGDGSPAAGLLAEGSRRAAGLAAPPPQAPAMTRPTAAERGQPTGTPGRTRRREPGLPAGPRPRRAAASRPHQAQRRGARRRRPAPWAIAGGAVGAIILVVLVALLIVHLAQGDSPPAHGKIGAGSHSPAATASPTASATTGPTTPTAFGGTWSGPVTQDSTTFTAMVTLISGQSSGSIVYTGADFTCSGDLSLTSATATTMTMSQGIVAGQSQCIDGTLTLTMGASGSVSFRFKSQSASAGPATGTLTRQ
jgi:hypothetical protein